VKFIRAFVLFALIVSASEFSKNHNLFDFIFGMIFAYQVFMVNDWVNKGIK